MKGAVLVAIAATIGNFLQGWDNATIAGAIVYIKDELDLETTVEGLVVAMSLIGATLITTCSGAISDMVGRRPMLILSSLFYFLGGLIMLWSPNVYVLLVARLIDGFGIGLAVTIVPIYISETAPPHIRGLLNTLPQFTGSGGMFLAYCMIFGMSLQSSTSWRVMLGVLSLPSLLYLVFAVFYLPESPRWLVSKGRMLEAKDVLQRLLGVEDVAGELAMLVGGLEVGVETETSIEEYIIRPSEDDDQDTVKLYGPEEGLTWVAKPVTGENMTDLPVHHGILASHGIPHMDPDPLVTFFDSVHEKIPETDGTVFPNYGSGAAFPHPSAGQFDIEEGQEREEEEDNDDDSLEAPLITHQPASMDPRGNSLVLQGNADEATGSTVWQLAWEWSEIGGEDEKKEGELKRVYLRQDPTARRGSAVSIPGGGGGSLVFGGGGGGDSVQVSALVSSTTAYPKELLGEHPVGPAMIHPAGTASRGPSWAALLDPGVKHALLVGVGIQILQQFAGINGVLYYTPQILEDAGVEVLLADWGISSTSASFLISAFTTFLMLPCIALAMKLMDISGRRALLLTTIPVLIGSLVILVIAQVVSMSSVATAAISTTCVIVYFCCFVMGYGPIPNILCSEIFPTRVRGLCIAICALVYWICDIIVTYTLPVMLTYIGLAGVFSIYAVVCIISWIFVYLKVPETKSMPLELITQIFATKSKDGVKDE